MLTHAPLSWILAPGLRPDASAKTGRLTCAAGFRIPPPFDAQKYIITLLHGRPTACIASHRPAFAFCDFDRTPACMDPPADPTSCRFCTCRCMLARERPTVRPPGRIVWASCKHSERGQHARAGAAGPSRKGSVQNQRGHSSKRGIVQKKSSRFRPLETPANTCRPKVVLVSVSSHADQNCFKT